MSISVFKMVQLKVLFSFFLEKDVLNGYYFLSSVRVQNTIPFKDRIFKLMCKCSLLF